MLIRSANVIPRPSPAAAAESVSAPEDARMLVICPSRGWVALNLGDIWEYRELLYFLTWRDLKVRYKQTALGVAWAIIQPLFTMAVFSLFFGRLAHMPSDGVAYPVFSFTALLPWGLFANALGQASNSLVGSSNLLTKVYFPRLIIPLSSVLSGLVDFTVALGVLLILLPIYSVTPGVAVLAFPLFVLLALVAALGVGLWLSALNVEYRDVKYVVPFLTQFWLFATPVAYPSNLLSEPWRTVYGLNPMVGVVEGFRWALLGTQSPGPLIAVSATASVALLVSGLYYFRRMERTFADVI
jgi:lipopolysaccharide transport system permease protein